jgi:selenocysteine-specific elongation factor
VGSFIIGTAGHIDHGKSALVEALTGHDPDRLDEEKRRGITIDLGFAHAEWRGQRLSFIDVPGHERFVRNMLAGAHGVDVVLLVVAADESVMPQTLEHFQICRLLGIPRGVIALTKCDVADEEFQRVAQLEVRDLVKGSFLEGAPVIRCSAHSGQGLDELRDALVRTGGRPNPRPSRDWLRLPIDRVFTMRGFGTVVTGTLVSGTISTGEDLVVMPSRLPVRVRSLQVHGEAASSVSAGHRTAVNLVGVDVRSVTRGDALCPPATFQATTMLDVEVELLDGERALRDQSRIRVHVASAEVLGRVRLLGNSALAAGERAIAQLRLERSAVVGRGDRLILRSYSPSVTIGGARVLDPLPPKRRRADTDAVAALAALRPGDALGAAQLMIGWAGTAGIEWGRLAARLSMRRAALADLLGNSQHVVILGKPPGAAIAEKALEALRAAIRDRLATFHAEHPLEAGMSREELRRRVSSHAAPGSFDEAVGTLERTALLRSLGDTLALAGHVVTLSPAEQEAREALEHAARAAGLTGIEIAHWVGSVRGDTELAQRVARVLVNESLLCRIGDDLLVHALHLERLARDVRAHWGPKVPLDIAGFKSMTGLTRKHAMPLLAYLDARNVTRRSGNQRFVLP